jgi:uncharacterized protein YjiS (DUF1127 family)
MMITSTPVAGKRGDPIEYIRTYCSDRLTAIASWRRKRQAYRALSSLDDRALEDIGLTRTMLLSVSIHETRT